MARPLTPDNLLAALKEWGIPYAETPDWRARSNQGGWGSVEGFMWHHTGDDAPDSADLKVVTDGRPGLSGPLCNFGLADDGKVHLVAAGAANHAGGGDAAVLRAMIARAPLPASRYSHDQLGDFVNAIIGNPRFAGVESFYYATNSPAQRKMMTKLAACWIWAMNKQNGTTWGAERAIGHREWQRGKIDPRVFGTDSLTKMRAEVAAYLKAGPKGTEDIVDAEDIKNIASAVMSASVGRKTIETGAPLTLAIAVDRMYSSLAPAAAERAANRATIEGLAGALKALAGGAQFDEQKLLDSIGERVRSETAQAIVDAGKAINEGVAQ